MDSTQPTIKKLGYLWLINAIFLLIMIGELYFGKYQQMLQVASQSIQQVPFGMGSNDSMMGLAFTIFFIFISIWLIIFSIVSFIIGYGFLTGKIRNWKITFLGIFSSARHKTIASLTIIFLVLLDITLTFFIFSPITSGHDNEITQVGGGSFIDLLFVVTLFAIHLLLLYYLTRSDVKNYYKILQN